MNEEPTRSIWRRSDARLRAKQAMRSGPHEAGASVSDGHVNMENASANFAPNDRSPIHGRQAEVVIQHEKASMPLREGQVQYLIDAW